MDKKYAVRGRTHGCDVFFSCFILAALFLVVLTLSAWAAPEGGVVQAGSAQISKHGGNTLIQQNSQRAVIDWRGFGINADESVRFAQPSESSAALNRVTGQSVSVILGRMDANGQVLLINPHGIIFGKNAQINVGSLIATTANISNQNFLEGKLVFDQPGTPGAGIINAGTITAAQGGLIALVAPHVRNDGLIQARLGRVMMGSADTFTIDLYGDGLINLALSEESLDRLTDAGGNLVKNLISQTGTIDVAGGSAVLMTAEAAKGVLDSLINMSGNILADSAVQNGGRILLFANGGKAGVSGTLSANGTTGGRIDVLGEEVNAATTAKISAGGTNGGGTIHIGGAYQGGGNTYRSQNTVIDEGAAITANANKTGSGGEVVVWSDVETSFAGKIEARGGAEAGDGGKVEVSGKQNLHFKGQVDAGASNGSAGSLLLDPYDLYIAATEAALIDRILKTGTSTTVAADNDIYVNSVIDGRGWIAGGGLTLTAGRDLNVNQNVITNNGAINLFAGGAINLASEKAVFAGVAPIVLQSGGAINIGGSLFGSSLALTAGTDLAISRHLLSDDGSINVFSGGALNLMSGSAVVALAAPVACQSGGALTSDAYLYGSSLSLAAGTDLTVNHIAATNNGPITMTAGGAMGLSSEAVVSAGTAPVSLACGGALNSSAFLYGGGLALTAGTALTLNNYALTNSGAITFMSGGAMNLGSNAALYSGTAPISLESGGAFSSNGLLWGGNVAVSSANNIDVNGIILTDDGAVDLTAGGAMNLFSGTIVYSGTAPITLHSAGALTNAADLYAATLSLTSAAGSVSVNKGIESAIGNVSIQAGDEVNLNASIVSLNDGNALAVSAGGDININAQIDGRPSEGANPNGAVTMTAGQDINLSKSILAHSINLTAAGTMNAPTMKAALQAVPGSVSGAPTVTLDVNGVPQGEGLFAGGGPISVITAGDISSGVYVTTGPLSVRSTGGNVNVDTKIAETLGNVLLKADAGSVNVDQEIANIRSGHNLGIEAGTDININRKMDALDDSNPLSITPVAGGQVTLIAVDNVNVNESVTTNNGAIGISAGGTVTQSADGTDAYGAPKTKQIGSGNADLTVIAGGNLSTGSLVTTGALNIRSTAGNVNINVPIYETTGNTTVQAGNDININEAVANTTSGSNLVMISGGDINVNAKVGPWDRTTGTTLGRNAVAGGTINMSAGNDINLHADIQSYKGALTDAGAAAITLNAGGGLVSGTVNLDDGIKVMSDGGAINATAYSDLTNGVYINDDPTRVNETPATGYFTTGALNLTSTSGNLTINQTIPDTTGAVTLTGGNGIIVNQRIYSNQQDITLIAGPGGIFMSETTDTRGASGTRFVSDIDARSADLTLISEGDIDASTLRTYGNLLVKSTNGSILDGSIEFSRNDTGEKFPTLVELYGSLGISGFNTLLSRNIKAMSNRGSIAGLIVDSPAEMEVIARDDINMSGWLGTASLYAGRDILNENGVNWAGTIVERAGRHITVGSSPSTTAPAGTADFSFNVSSLNLSAGTNPFSVLSDDHQIAGVTVKALKDGWTSLGTGNITVSDCAWIAGEGGLVATATGDISMSNIHVSYILYTEDETIDARQALQPLTLTAGGNINLPGLIETMGPITLTSSNGNITVALPLGGNVSVETPSIYVWNPYNKGVGDVTIAAYNGRIFIPDIRSEGNVTVRAYGDGFTTGYVGGTCNAIQVPAGKTVTVQDYHYNALGAPVLDYTWLPGVDYATIMPVAVFRLPAPLPSVPGYTPGPVMSGPASPSSAGALPPISPSAATALTAPPPAITSVADVDSPDVTVADVPDTEQTIDQPQVEAQQQTVQVNEQEVEQSLEVTESGDIAEFDAKKKKARESDEEGTVEIIYFPGGKGVTQTADLGRR